MPKSREIHFEDEVFDILSSTSGWLVGDAADIDLQTGIFSYHLLQFIGDTQIAEWNNLTLIHVGVIRAAGLEVRPTFRRPHFTVMLSELDPDLDRLVACNTVVQDNPYHQPPEARP